MYFSRLPSVLASCTLYLLRQTTSTLVVVLVVVMMVMMMTVIMMIMVITAMTITLTLKTTKTATTKTTRPKTFKAACPMPSWTQYARSCGNSKTVEGNLAIPRCYHRTATGCHESTNRLVGLEVKESASRAEDPRFEFRLPREFFGVESYQ